MSFTAPREITRGAQSVKGLAPALQSPHADHRLAKVDASKQIRESHTALIDPLVFHGN